jgi:hypothetical protein
MSYQDELIALTQSFFAKHWGVEAEEPEWDFSWEWRGPVPNYLVGGVYALFKGGEVLYVGLGNSRGGGIYQDRGISRRLMAHVIKSAPSGSGKDSVLRERWEAAGVDKVATLGFPEELNYLAPALEDFFNRKAKSLA